VVELRGQGVKPEEIAVKLGISRASVFRVLKGRREAAAELMEATTSSG
jgi:predicted transcriptional regulator